MSEKYVVESCFESLDEYAGFAEGREKMTFIRFKNLFGLEKSKPNEITRMLLGPLRWFRPKYVSVEGAQQLIK